MLAPLPHVATAPPDGHTLAGFHQARSWPINPVLYKKVNYDPDKDFAPISFYVKSPFILVVNHERAGQDRPGADQVRQGEPRRPVTVRFQLGIGHRGCILAGEYMKQRFGLNMTHVPYRNTGQSLSDISRAATSR